jgi:hypothetical protein
VQPPPALLPTATDSTSGIIPPTAAGPTGTPAATPGASRTPTRLTPSGPLSVARPASPQTSASTGNGGTISIEAESSAAVRSGRASVRGLAGASGGAVVTGIGDHPKNLVRFTDITVPADGTYTVTFHYVTAEPRRARVTVNWGEPTTVDFPGSGNWDTVETMSVRLPLATGPNTIEFGNRNSWAPDLDRIVVSR